MNIIIHQTHHSIANFEEIFSYIKSEFRKEVPGIHIFPELFLCGYPLQDLCLQKAFIDQYQAFIKELRSWLNSHISKTHTCLLMGGLDYELTKEGLPGRIKNVVYQYGDSQDLCPVYTKRLLPNYDIFDEKKYFSQGEKAEILSIFDQSFGILICEDMWNSNAHQLDPVEDLHNLAQKSQTPLDAIFNLSASPYNIEKPQKRIKRAKIISHKFSCPFYYINKVGAEDEILFDGQSFLINADELLLKGKRFQSDRLEQKLAPKITYETQESGTQPLAWEELFQARLKTSSSPATLTQWSNDECQEVLEALCFGFQDYAHKNGFKKFTIALSGGMDSALVLCLIHLSLKKGQTLEAIYMPSIHSSTLSYELSFEICKNLSVPFKSLPIKFLHSTAKNLFKQTFHEEFEGITDENIQSRLRGMLLYSRSNQINSMVVNTSNKSELAIGYSTQYGDSVGAISLLGDLFKSEVYRLANFINKHYSSLIPEGIITRAPTAELREDQIDSQTLPPYHLLDAILEGILNYRYSKKDLISLGFSCEDVEKTLHMYRRSEYKRYQFCPIIKISSKSFGFGYRVPISKNSDFYNQ